MPILNKEEDLFPHDLLDDLAAGEYETVFPADEETPRWWALYTLSRREKQL